VDPSGAKDPGKDLVPRPTPDEMPTIGYTKRTPGRPAGSGRSVRGVGGKTGCGRCGLPAGRGASS
jgi:hypothetical protein